MPSLPYSKQDLGARALAIATFEPWDGAYVVRETPGGLRGPLLYEPTR